MLLKNTIKKKMLLMKTTLMLVYSMIAIVVALEKPKKRYNDISEYKPTGRLVYNPEILQKIEKKGVV